jgi:hypothetical protein
MDQEYLKKSEIFLKHNKIFTSLLSLNYKNEKIEAKYLDISERNYEKYFFIFLMILMFKSLFLTIFEGTLFFLDDKQKGNNLKYNFFMSLIVTVLSGFLLFSFVIQDKKKNRIYKYSSMFILHFLLEKNFLSIISIVIVYFQLGIEIVSFTFLMKIITNFCVSIFIFRKFIVTLFIIVINTAINHIFLLKIHVIKAILYYIFTDTAFMIIILSFVYMLEYLTRMYFYSFIRLAKEKEYILETLNSFNVSYFMSYNYDVIDHTKLNKILKEEASKTGKFTIKQIEKVFQHVVMVEHINPEIEDYFSESIIKNNQPFKFKKFISLLKKNEHELVKYYKFSNFAIFKLKSELNDDFYVQLFLKIKIKEVKREPEKSIMFFLGDSEYEKSDSFKHQSYTNVKIEGIFLDVTQSYLKKEAQVNSSLMIKYMQDLKIPLCLLDQIINISKKNPPYQINGSNEIDKRFNFKSTCGIEIDKKFSSQHIEHSKYLKIVYKNVLDTMDIIDNFIKKQISNNLSDHNYNSRENPNEIISEKVNLRKVIISCVNFYQIFINFNPNKKNVKLITYVNPNIPNYIKSNKLLIKQVLMNLISNALKFTYSGEVKVNCKLKSSSEVEHKQNIEIAVIDSGVGIENENLVKLSKPPCISSIRQETGQGLKIVNEILQDLDSKLIIHSVKNKGSSFSFVLPVDSSLCYKEFEIDLKKYGSSSPDSSIDECYDRNLIDELNKNKPKNSLKFFSDYCEIKEEFYEDNSDSNNRKYSNNQFENIFHESSDHESENLSPNEFESEMENKCAINNKTDKPNYPYLFKTKDFNDKKFKKNIVKNSNEFISRRTNNFIGSCKESSTNFNSVVDQSFNILIVIDDYEYHLLIKDRFKNISKEFNDPKVHLKYACCFNPLEAINIIYQSYKNKEYIDLVICDEFMPFMRGSHFAKLYKSILELEGLYSLKFSLFDENSFLCDYKNEDEMKEIKYFDYFISKNFKKEDIFLIIKEIISM